MFFYVLNARIVGCCIWQPELWKMSSSL